MPDDRWTRAKQILNDFLDAKPDDRDAWLDARCDDPALRTEVEALLKGHAEGPLSRDPGAADWVDPKGTGSEVKRPEAGTHLGGYRLLEEIGVGGMGVVYRAERADADVEQTVAVKVLQRRLRAADAEQRFRAERQVLASLDHPNIAQFIDGGVTEGGRPYLVMEHVNGRPITEYAGAHDLELEARLDLVEQVTEAVQAAHRRLVVHRDLKPSNVLVTETDDGPRVKLLDFGIAKLLDDSLPVTRPETRTGHHLMTPSYAAPEQVTSGEVTTATDTYQIGVLAYELLAGRRPFDLENTSPTKVERLVVDTDPPPPSERTAGGAVAPDRLRGDLDVIVAKALRKEPDRRYPSGEALAADLQRHRRGEPVEARPATLGYRAGKFLRRHRWGVGVATAFLIVIVAAGTLLVRQRNEARQEAKKAERVSDFLAGLFEASSPYTTGGDTTSARDLMRRGQRRVSSLQDEPEVRAQMLDAMGRAHTGLGNYHQADSLLQQGLTIRRRLYEPPHDALAASLTHRAEALHGQGRYAVAGSLDRQALDMRRRLYDSPHPDIAESLRRLAERLARQGSSDRPMTLYRRALSMQRELFGDGHPAVATTIHSYAELLKEHGAYARADSLLQEALTIRERKFGPRHPTTLSTRKVLAETVEWRGRLARAESLKTRTLQHLRDRMPKTHPSVIKTVNALAIVLRKRGAYGRAKSLFRRALERFRTRYPDSHPHIASVLKNLAQIHRRQGNWETADSLAHRSLAMHRQFFDKSHTRIVAVMSDIAAIERARGRLKEAESLYRDVLNQLRRTYETPHPYVAITYGNLARTLGKQGKHAAADSLFGRALAMKQKTFGPQHHRVAATLDAMATWRRTRGHLEAAEMRARQALARRRAVFGSEQPKTAKSLHTLGRVLQAQSRHEAADSLYRAAVGIFQASYQGAHPNVAETLWDWGVANLEQDSLATARQLLRRALATERAVTGGPTTATGRVLEALARVRRTQGHSKRADSLSDRAQKVYREVGRTE
jgi:tetratricopeptide (TPR) repeat protein